MSTLSPDILKVRLDVVLAHLGLEADLQAAFERWIAIEDFDVDTDVDRLLLTAVAEVLPPDRALVALIHTAYTFRKSLAEARDGLG
ncbi:MAG: hypothetical protein J0J10_23320 [Bosea sp.]|uniref:hypothetical protein n=1 Tax=Bosea sp. (in: a-proteobacteria) TaxID=1871050 RepID=UPI001AD325EA|nr:hypothetical protein [Bosea sp. (in: a-proteobacteria)]MBN9471704.1 hypothetical protein [Bosea sp. (in: a-proteobacteria)]